MIDLCTNVNCQLKNDCTYFDKAVDYNSGKVGGPFHDILDCHGKSYKPKK